MATSYPVIPRYGSPNLEYLARASSLTPEEDGPVFMVNLMKYRQFADYGDGPSETISGRDADARYAPLDILAEVGAEVVFAADVTRQLIGVPTWDRVGVVRYPTRAAFLAMQRRPDFQERHIHKQAAMAQSIVVAGVPLAIPELPPVEVPPPTAGDAPFVMIHVLRFAEGGRAAMDDYGGAIGEAAFSRGIRPEARFEAEATVVGDGRQWDEVRFNRFPGLAAFQSLVTDPVHQAAQPGRAGALTDTFTMMVTPTLDAFARTTPGR